MLLRLGRQPSDNDLGVNIAHIRKYVSSTFVKVQTICLINRRVYLECLEQGAKATEGRRDLARRLEVSNSRPTLEDGSVQGRAGLSTIISTVKTSPNNHNINNI